jgi:hypothetical protein
VIGAVVEQLDDLRVQLVNGLAMGGDVHKNYDSNISTRGVERESVERGK